MGETACASIRRGVRVAGEGDIPTRWLVTSWTIILIYVFLFFTTYNPGANDFIQYYVGARNLRETGNPYSRTAAEMGLGVGSQNCYPPLMSYLCLPLAWASPSEASYVWLCLNLIMTGALAWQLLAVLRPGRDVGWRSWTLAFGFLMCYPPQITGTSLGQVHAFVAVLICGAYLCARSGAEGRAGVLAAGAALLKLFPGLLILAFLAAGHRRAALVAVAVSLLFVALTWGEHRDYLQEYVMKGYYPVAAPCFVSIPAMATRLFVEGPYAIAAIPSPFWYRCVLVSGSSVVLIGLAWLFLLRTGERLVVAAVLCAMLLLTPPAGYYHLNLALLAAALLAADRRRADTRPSDAQSPGGAALSDRRTPRKAHLVLILVLLLTAIPVEYGLTDASAGLAKRIYVAIHSGWGTLLLTPQTYGLVLLFAICLYQARSESRGVRV
jgi:hypothetical protein